MPLANLANELILLIAKNLGPKDLGSLLLANKSFACLLTPLLGGLAIEDVYGMSALCWAVEQGHKTLVKLLLDKGIDINTRTRNGPAASAYFGAEESGMTPLIWAATGGDKEMVKLLLDRGASVHVTTFPRKTAFLVAAGRGNIGICRLLLDHGADIEAQLPSGDTALHIAAERNRVSLIKFLLDRGIDINRRNHIGQTALHRCIGFGSERYEAAKMLVKSGIDVDAMDINSRAAFHILTDARMVGVLVEGGANINIRGQNGATPLHSAVFVDYPLDDYSIDDLIEELLANGADASIKDSTGRTAQQIATPGHALKIGGILEKRENSEARISDL